MTRAHLIPMLPLVVLAFACGPTIEPSHAETGSSSASEGSESPATTTAPPPSTSTTTSTTSISTDTTADTTGLVFLMVPDGGSCGAPGNEDWRCSECDIFAQDCPRGEKCMPWANDGGNAWNATRCSPIADNPGQPGDPCSVEGSGVSGIDDCDLLAMCWNVDPKTTMGTCVAFCEGVEANPFCSAGTSCVLANDGVLALCLPHCDPLLAAACPTDQTCTAVNTLSEDPVCIPSVGVDVWPCGDGAVCNPGETCLDAEVLAACVEFGCCTPWCDWTAADPDAACAAEPAHACQPYYEPGAAPMGLEHLGVCRLPA